MKRISIFLLPLVLAAGCTPKGIPYGQSVTLDRETLQDKIKGGWAGQTIGCTFGGPTEFKHKGGIIHDEEPIAWYDDYALDTFREDPGLYDDVYMDLTFMETMAREGIGASAESYALAFANADYKLWHANQAARYNILHGVMPPESGHWKNNPHADDIDFQIEADFIGMITPGMVNSASAIADRIGHIMNCGDGFYGGVFIGAMYSLAFVCDDIPTLVAEALRAIPAESKFHRCIADVIALHRSRPD
ncbi:MAG: ADP-ribosylglycohydrolase family protein, partial [Alistipes sp.]|nr:ADP-ribosylglycohydrolase family protein [Alistipes sp.]